MVAFNDSHKEQIGRETYVQWFKKDGTWGEIDISTMSDDDLWDLSRRMENFMKAQMKVVHAELDNWTPMFCSVCGEEDLAYRGKPFVTWGIRDGYILCPRHLEAVDRTPEENEARKLTEIFGV